MNFSNEIFDALAPFEKYFETAVGADWCPYPGRDALALMHDALDTATGTKTRQDYTCGPCLLRLVKRVGRMYYADKTERTATAAETAPAPRKKTTTKPRKK